MFIKNIFPAMRNKCSNHLPSQAKDALVSRTFNLCMIAKAARHSCPGVVTGRDAMQTRMYQCKKPMEEMLMSWLKECFKCWPLSHHGHLSTTHSEYDCFYLECESIHRCIYIYIYIHLYIYTYICIYRYI